MRRLLYPHLGIYLAGLSLTWLASACFSLPTADQVVDGGPGAGRSETSAIDGAAPVDPDDGALAGPPDEMEPPSPAVAGRMSAAGGTATGGSLSEPPDGGGPTPPDGGKATPTGKPTFPLVGYATLGAGTTGGLGDPHPVTVDSGEALQRAIDGKGDGPLTVFVEGRLTHSDGRITVEDVSDVSILGLDDGAELDGVGLYIGGASNIIVRNLRIHHVEDDDGDAIRVTDGAHHVWIDHCALHSDLEHEEDHYGGLLDVVHGADFVTVSWNHFYNHFRVSLVGHSDDNRDQDEDALHVTFHHNYFEHVSSRLPSVRFGDVHVFNNLYRDITDEGDQAGTAISARMDACVRLEHNLFDNVDRPVRTDQSDEDGAVQLIDNVFDDTTPHDLPECSLTPPYDYQEALDPAENLDGILRERVGVGVL